MIKLNNKVTLYVPMKNNAGKDINTELIQSNLIRAAGGCTTYKAAGFWVDNGAIYKDNILAMQVNYTNDQAQTVVTTLNKMIVYLLTIGEQLSVSIESYNGLTIYDQDDTLTLSKQVVKAL